MLRKHVADLNWLIYVIVFIYIARISISGSNYVLHFNIGLLLCLFILAFALIKQNPWQKFHFPAEYNYYFLIILNILAYASLFLMPTSFASQAMKICLYLIILAHIAKDFRGNLYHLNNAFLVAVLTVITLSEMNLIETDANATELWEKNYAGFINPNLAPIFLYAVFATYLYLGKIKHAIAVSLLVIVFWVFFDVLSRTAFSCMLLSIVLYIAAGKSSRLDLYLKYSSYLLIAGFPIYLIFIFYAFSGGDFDSSAIYQKLNTLLSSRLSNFSERPFINSSNIIGFFPTPFDGLLNDTFFMFGPLSLIIILVSFWGAVRQKSSKFLSFIIPLLIFNYLEGIFLKFTPASIILVGYFLTAISSKVIPFTILRYVSIVTVLFPLVIAIYSLTYIPYKAHFEISAPRVLVKDVLKANSPPVCDNMLIFQTPAKSSNSISILYSSADKILYCGSSLTTSIIAEGDADPNTPPVKLISTKLKETPDITIYVRLALALALTILLASISFYGRENTTDQKSQE